MNTLVIVLIAAVCLVAGYCLYGRWLANKWGIDPNAKTPAVRKNDGQDFVPTDGLTVLIHRWCRPCHRCYSGRCLRLGSCSSLDPDRRHLLRRRYRLWCIICQCQK